MPTMRVAAERAIAAPADRVFGFIADDRTHDPRFLPLTSSDGLVEEGGGGGTAVRFALTVAGRRRDDVAHVTEPDPGRVLTEACPALDGATTFTVAPDGAGSRVRIETVAPSAGGTAGAIERFPAPRLLGRLDDDELARLGRYAREHAADRPIPPVSPPALTAPPP